jgi:16S rRNA (uracil1498-N3)-methyltransferase
LPAVAAPRFFVDGDLAVGRPVHLPAAVAHHARVLRLRDGDAVVLFNGRGGEFRGRLTAAGTGAELAAHDPVERESPADVTLLQAWIATDKLDWMVEKSVELGVARIALAPARRSVVQLAGTRRARRLDRLREIVVAACCQCGRNRVPSIEAFDDLANAFARCAGAGVSALMLQPGAAQSVYELARAASQAFALAVGPEGGFEPHEVDAALRAGFRPAHLGARVLRTETAGVAALAAIQTAAGDLR